MHTELLPLGSLIRRLAMLATTVTMTVFVGCAPTKTFLFTSDPTDAQIKLDSVVRGIGSARSRLAFDTPTRTYMVVASRPGFEDASATLSLDTSTDVALKLKPKRKPITINVQPAASVTLDNRSLGEPAESFKVELVYDLGADRTSRPKRVLASRLGYKPQSINVDFDDSTSTYSMTLQPVTKDLFIDTQPTGARLTLDGKEIGTAPVRLKDETFAIDLKTNQWVPRKLIAQRAGFAPTSLDLTFDQGQVEYRLPLKLLEKTVRITTEPAGATIQWDEKSPAADGTLIADQPLEIPLSFQPLDDKGLLPAYEATVTLNRPGEQWEPAKLVIPWDDGQTDYKVTLKEITERPMQLTQAGFAVRDGRWQVVMTNSPHTAFKSVADDRLPVAQRVTDLPPGTLVDSFAISPDGKSIVLSVLQPVSDANPTHTKPTARLVLTRIDGPSSLTNLTDGRHLDLMPVFSPAGDRVIFSSNRGGENFAVWSLPMDGSAGTTRIASSDAHLLWPSVDSQARERAFYQSLLHGQTQPRIFSTVAGTVFETDLVNIPGEQPRVGPGNDAVLFVSAPRSDAARDLYRTSDKGGGVQQLTQTPDLDERDPVWSPDGKFIVFARSKYTDNNSAGQTPQAAITNLFRITPDGSNEQPLTNNPAISDRPAFDSAGEFVYFRSTRGGKLDIWRMPIE